MMPGEERGASKSSEGAAGLARSRRLTVHGYGHGDRDGQADPDVAEIRHPRFHAVEVKGLQHDGKDGAQRPHNGILENGD